MADCDGKGVFFASGEAPVALNWNGTARSSVPTPTPSGSAPDWIFKSVAASSPSHVWLFGTDNSSGEPMILSHS